VPLRVASAAHTIGTKLLFPPSFFGEAVLGA